ncbi:IS66 family transposase [Endozoicomonas sp. 4G]|uniref:IS66 family transposase n=1 Tax=Endozoicomonas sp. 4G TaxID=2872754 RepID=UPI0020788DA4|nr:IS66 family transposase [Endozoicomonas sp. 4G]
MNLPAPTTAPSSLQLLQQMQALLVERDQKLVERDQKIASLEQQLAWFKQQLFGEKSEKRLIENPDQLSLGEILQGKPKEQEVPTETITYERRKKSRPEDCVTDQGLRFTEDVPVELIPMPAVEMQGEDADQYEVIDYKYTYRLAQRPASYVILKYQREVVRHKPSQTLTTVAAPSGLFDRSFADVSFIAGLLVEKYRFHAPLYRQHQKLESSGITISRGTLTHLEQRAGDLLKPIADEVLNSCLESQVLALDETAGKAGRKSKGKMQKGYFWCFYGDQDEMAFTFSTSRSGRVVEPYLKEFGGTLLTDGYPEYDRLCEKYPQITHAQCWTHSRRYFVKSQDAEPEATKEALDCIGAIYKVEDEIRKAELQGEEKREYRQQKAKPLVDQFFNWHEKQLQRLDLVKSNPLSKALGYVNKREKELRVYLDDPNVAIDTNHLERGLRCIPMGRKNWMFCWTEEGADNVAVFQTLIVSCLLAGIDPYKYFVDVLQRISLHPARDIRELIPRIWKEKFGANSLKSDLDK